MKRSIATVSLSGTLHEKLRAVATANFTGVEILDNNLLSFNKTIQNIHELSEQATTRGLRVGFETLAWVWQFRREWNKLLNEVIFNNLIRNYSDQVPGMRERAMH